MPMLDAFIPAGALTPEAETQLLAELTDLLIKHEGLDPTNERARASAVIWLHRPAAVYAAGVISKTVRYRFIPSVPEGQYNDEARSAVVRDVTAAVAKAEGLPFDEVGPRVWVFPNEIADGGWGGRGLIRRLPDILSMIEGEHARTIATAKLAERRRKNAVSVLLSALAVNTKNT